MKNYFLTTISLFAFSLASYALTSDTITVRHYDIHIDTINYSTQSIRASTTLTVVSKLNNVNNITLSLLHFTVDSIVSNSQPLAYSYNDTVLHIAPLTVLNVNDSITLSVSYHGQPQQDPSWGGFYFSGTYAFNLGVSFNEDPHNFGRAWFPCIDEFTDRSTYDFFIRTPDTYKAFCNGVLVSGTNNGDGTSSWHWKMNQTIPSYLASMAVAPYYTLQRTYSGIPVQWAVLASDTNATLGTFTNIGTAISTFINAYGPYRWDKIGYVATSPTVIFGGMEHATSIHISKAFFDGSLNYETLWAHELSHMWWGDNVTCETEQDMWLNEGFAVYSEFLFTESVYGATAYKNSVRTNHRKVLQLAHIIDGNYLALNAVPHAYSYTSGGTVYGKGPDVAHTLRKYMGDSLFFVGCRGYMNNRAYGNANSAQLRDEMASASSINLNRFFDDWVFTPGFPHFSIDSVVTVPNGSVFDVYVYTRQRQKGNSHNYSMPVECTLADQSNSSNVTLLIDTTHDSFHLSLPFAPTFVALDRNDLISDAITGYETNITTTGLNNFPETNVSLNVQALGANNLVRIEHNWVKPDDFKYQNPGIRLSDYHFWKVDGLFDSSFIARAFFTFDGRTPAAANLGYIDNTLIAQTEDSLVLLYRKDVADEWQVISNATINFIGLHTDKSGNIRIDTLRKGEYVFGYRDYTLAVPSLHPSLNSPTLKAYPNPSHNITRIEFTLPPGNNGTISVYDAAGKNIYNTRVYSHQTFVSWDCDSCTSGTYTVILQSGQKKISEKIIIAGK